MKIRMLETRNEAGEIFSSGLIYDISKGQALTWIGCKIAEPVEKRKGVK